MKRHLEDLKKKPLHVRNRIAFGVSTLVTGFVALIWGSSLLTSHSLALKSEKALNSASTGSAQNSLKDSKNTFSELLGSVGAAKGVSSSSTEAGITITTGYASSTLNQVESSKTITKTRISF
jgi:hypothetical protein